MLIGIVVVVSLLGAAWTLWERSRHDPWLRLLERARNRLTEAGLQLAPNSPPRRMAEQITQQMSHQPSRPMRDWLLRMEALRYSEKPSISQPGIANLQRELRQMAWPK